VTGTQATREMPHSDLVKESKKKHLYNSELVYMDSLEGKEFMHSNTSN
jgi:hypothetical protein